MNKDNFDKTEDFSLDMDELKEITESLEDEVKDIKEKINHEMSSIQEEVHISDIDDDFKDIYRKRKLRRLEKNNEEEKAPKKRKLKKWVYVLLLILLLGIGGGAYYIVHSKQVEKRLAEEKAIIDNIKSHFNQYAKVSKDTTLYEKKDNKYQEIGTIYKDTNVELVEEEIKLDTKYFHIKDLDYYYHIFL